MRNVHINYDFCTPHQFNVPTRKYLRIDINPVREKLSTPGIESEIKCTTETIQVICQWQF